MLRIAGREVGSGAGAVEPATDAKTLPNCRFVVSCGCGKFYEEGQDGVGLFRMAQKHAQDTGHGAYGHFVFEAR